MTDQGHSQALLRQWLFSGGPKIYLAGRYDHIGPFREYKQILEELGYRVNARWLDGDNSNLATTKLVPQKEYPFTDHIGITRQNVATAGYLGEICVKDIVDAEIVVFFGEPLAVPARNGGRMVELGIAIGWNYLVDIIPFNQWKPHKKRIVIVGPRENGFTCLPWIAQVDNFDGVLGFLERMYGVG